MEKVNVTCPCCGAKTDMEFETMILAQDKNTVKKLLDRSLFFTSVRRANRILNIIILFGLRTSTSLLRLLVLKITG